MFSESPFNFDSDDDVKIMDGDDEGTFSWFTLNFLSGLYALPYFNSVTIILYWHVFGTYVISEGVYGDPKSASQYIFGSNPLSGKILTNPISSILKDICGCSN